MHQNEPNNADEDDDDDDDDDDGMMMVQLLHVYYLYWQYVWRTSTYHHHIIGLYLWAANNFLYFSDFSRRIWRSSSVRNSSLVKSASYLSSICTGSGRCSCTNHYLH